MAQESAEVMNKEAAGIILLDILECISAIQFLI